MGLPHGCGAVVLPTAWRRHLIPTASLKFCILFRSFGRNTQGVASLEFSLLAIPFFVMLFAIIECCASFTVQQVISQNATTLARELRIGALDGSSLNENFFKQYMCERSSIFVQLECDRLYIDLRSYKTISEIPRGLHYKNDGDIDVSDFKVQPGGIGPIKNLRVLYKWRLFTDLIRGSVSTLPDGTTILFSNEVWRSEPFN
ncbi:Flp pilus assembly protein TadG [Ochrobactrum sp. BH3]|nr:Flp pilus assembly protein TadG [Ochrobactrum sp. BH3]